MMKCLTWHASDVCGWWGHVLVVHAERARALWLRGSQLKIMSADVTVSEGRR